VTCSSPYFSRLGAYACGKCSSCRSLRRRTWAHRIMIEAYGHVGRSTFITLTYAADVKDLSVRDCQLFLKRIRKATAGPLRFFCAGEYGDISERPHYHFALFGLPTCGGGPIHRVGAGYLCHCATCSAVRRAWPFGHVTVAELNPRRAMYIASYTVKKMTHRADPRLYGREPEFARMSLRPGIGAVALSPVTSSLARYRRKVPGGLRHGQRVLPLGRYLRLQVARTLTDGSNSAVKDILGVADTVSKTSHQMSLLRSYAWTNRLTVSEAYRQVFSISTENEQVKVSKVGRL
jgi:hypothetical protein